MYPDKVIERFEQRFGASPEIVVRAPGRINVIGEHTDYNEGLVLPAAIDLAVYFAATARDDNRIVIYADDIGESYEGWTQIDGPLGNWVDYLLGAYVELQLAGFKPGGINLVFGGDLPAGVGLSSSAALETGMLFVLNDLYSLGVFKQDMIHMAQMAENNFVGAQCGIMDMFATVKGRAGRAIRLDCRSMEFEYYPLELEGYSFLVCHSGLERTLTQTGYNQRRAECEEGVTIFQELQPGVESLRDLTSERVREFESELPPHIYRRCLFVAEENTRVEAACTAIEAYNCADLGRLMYETHAGLRDLFEVSCPEIDFLVDLARQSPDIAGARLMGGGFGGSTLNLIRTGAVAEWSQMAAAAYAEAFGRSLQCYPVRLSEGVGEWE